jgi:hypothetical protein
VDQLLPKSQKQWYERLRLEIIDFALLGVSSTQLAFLREKFLEILKKFLLESTACPKDMDKDWASLWRKYFCPVSQEKTSCDDESFEHASAIVEEKVDRILSCSSADMNSEEVQQAGIGCIGGTARKFERGERGGADEGPPTKRRRRTGSERPYNSLRLMANQIGSVASAEYCAPTPDRAGTTGFASSVRRRNSTRKCAVEGQKQRRDLENRSRAEERMLKRLPRILDSWD